VDEDDIAGLETFDMVAYKLRTTALVENDQLHFGMIMPAVVYERIPVLAYAEGVFRRFGNLE